MFQTKTYHVVNFFMLYLIAMTTTSHAEDTLVHTPKFLRSVIALGDTMPGEMYGIYGQFTFVDQWHPEFRAPYSGGNSLDPKKSNDETSDITLMLGRKLWKGAEFWINSEIDQGFGLSNTVGVAGFPSGEAYKIGANTPYLRIPRAFIRQVFALNGLQENIETLPNQFGGQHPLNNLTVTLGKFSVADIFDTNTYAHDPRSDFFNWSIIDSGAFDYAADSWGFTYGAAAELNHNWWTLRGGLFELSKVPNGKIIVPSLDQYSLVAEAEERHQLFNRPGKLKILAFVNRGEMASYQDATQLAQQTRTIPNVSLVRRFASRPGFAVNLEQALSSDLGIFARLSANDGSKEAYEFSDINKSFAAGLSLHGVRWGRPNDVLGIAGVVNGLSTAAKEYFSAGGMGVLVGDGLLNYGAEKIMENYYAIQLTSALNITLNYQYVTNPGYNRDRGPVSIYGVRIHTIF